MAPDRGMVQLDGSFGEGGGQVLRSALAVSVWTGKSFRIVNIRAGREKPGLKAQHLTAIRMVAQVCGAKVKGADLGSQELTFIPGEVRSGTYTEEVGTAGATSLVAQAAAPPLLHASGASLLKISGGTHVAWAPPFEYLRDVYSTLLARLGFRLNVRLLRYGFYPRGGGRIGVEIEGGMGEGFGRRGDRVFLEHPPHDRIRVEAISVVSSLPADIGARMNRTVAKALAGTGWSLRTNVVKESGPVGTYVFVRVFSDDQDSLRTGPFILGGFTGLGARGKPAERVADEAVVELLDFLDSDASLDPRLADQILVPAVMAGTPLTFKTNRVTQHLRTNAATIAHFLGPCVEVAEDGRVFVDSA